MRAGTMHERELGHAFQLGGRICFASTDPNPLPYPLRHFSPLSTPRLSSIPRFGDQLGQHAHYADHRFECTARVDSSIFTRGNWRQSRAPFAPFCRTNQHHTHRRRCAARPPPMHMSMPCDAVGKHVSCFQRGLAKRVCGGVGTSVCWR